MAPRQVIVDGATRARPGETSNGDAWFADWHEGSCRIAVVDGLGHGDQAAEASRLAIQCFKENPSAPPDQIIRLCHASLSRSRGAAITVVSIDVSGQSLVYCGIGNVDGRLWQAGKERGLTLYRGIVGGVLGSFRCLDFPLGDDWLLVLYSDGIRRRFSLAELTTGEQVVSRPDLLARNILGDFARESDDATVVVAQPRRESPDSQACK